MPVASLIGLGAGIAAALLLISAGKGAMFLQVALLLLVMLPFFLAALVSMLPIFVAGLGWGVRSALIASFVGTALVSLLIGPLGAAIWFVSQILPVLVLCYLTLLNRRAPATTQPAAGPPLEAAGGGVITPQQAAAGTQWYPLGRLVAIAAVMSGALTGFSFLLLGTDYGVLKDRFRANFEAAVKQFPELAPPGIDDAALSQAADHAVALLPVAGALAALLLLVNLLFNMWLAARVTRASGRLARPWPDLAAFTLPPGMGIGFAAAVIGTFLGGIAGLVATGFAGAFLCAYVLLGLAIVHYVTRGHPNRVFILWGVYIALIILNAYAVLALAVIGLAEPFSPLSRHLGQHPPPPPSDNNRST